MMGFEIMYFKQFFSLAALFALLVGSFTAQASNTHPAEKVIKKTTDNVLVLIDDARSYYDKDPAKFYKKIDNELVDVIDFQSFARGVMGPYGSSKAYKALKTNQEKAQFKARVLRFSEIFKNALVETYAKGLFAFGGNKIEVNAIDSATNDQSALIEQRVYAKDNSVYKVLYKMRKNRQNEWKVRNVTIEAVNVGKVYQNQFRAAVMRYQGNVDKAIDNWSVEL